mmetsp:Transcript_78545/g.243657  ORF Transcript_78545/g.243657 Transcript_78545/m.243657 type:complete len:236 (-) Transcript_78545:4-711(-)
MMGVLALGDRKPKSSRTSTCPHRTVCCASASKHSLPVLLSKALASSAGLPKPSQPSKSIARRHCSCTSIGSEKSWHSGRPPSMSEGNISSMLSNRRLAPIGDDGATRDFAGSSGGEAAALEAHEPPTSSSKTAKAPLERRAGVFGSSGASFGPSSPAMPQVLCAARPPKPLFTAAELLMSDKTLRGSRASGRQEDVLASGLSPSHGDGFGTSSSNGVQFIQEVCNCGLGVRGKDA